MNEEYKQQAKILHEIRTRSSEEKPLLSGGNVSGSGNGNENGTSSLVVDGGRESIQGGKGSGKGIVFSGDTAVSQDPGREQEREREKEKEKLKDPMIYPGLYAPSGIDIIGILIRVRMRPNPTFDIGNVDSSAALVLCDASASTSPSTFNHPIIYCSEEFEKLTGYTASEIIGRNCRFLQTPPISPSNFSNTNSDSRPTKRRKSGSIVEEKRIEEINAPARKELRVKLEKGEEAQVKLVNYKKGGGTFVNLLTTIPIAWDDEEEGGVEGAKRYVVGFQVDAHRGLLGR